ncbi:poly-gamma-glutamate synthesis protein (capsule biosynthesis protein) [Alkalibacillus salilacus]|uniref:Poly-gamma-glutamate synthesis protein (Capsule biosynthesis protein) n=2 Tax=Alkalibacillus salilacus TaxID=284582 RepID=A0ABT9VD97_9BACI|nr:poly-gamma-glutamate synthesis protein (capsule biosynthesis protein) [Alkalibacillus salilacus]
MGITFILQEQSNQSTYTADKLTSMTHDLSNKESRKSITLNAVGDILIHDRVYSGAKEGQTYDFKPMLSMIKPQLESADLLFANQETMLAGEELGLSGYPQFNAPKSVADALKYVSTDIVSLANNHTLDYGQEAIEKTTNHLNDLSIDYIGSYHSESDQQEARILEKNGISVGFTAYTYGTNGIPRPEDKDYLVQYINDGNIKEDINEIEDQADFTVVSLHFGNQYEPLPTEDQKELVRELTEAGADIILGHHPHVLQPFEQVKTENHQSVVIYSLGNFLSGQREFDRRIGGILQLQLDKGLFNQTSETSVSNIRFMPTYVEFDDQGDIMHDVEVVPLIDSSITDLDTNYNDVENHMKHYSEQIQVVPHLEQVQ